MQSKTTFIHTLKKVIPTVTKTSLTTNPHSFSTDSARWAALVARDLQANGRFVYGVMTTGIYCRPICPSRRPNRENVQFFNNSAEAEQANFRPCKRCTPHLANQPDTGMTAVIRACHIIEEAEQPPTLNQLANAVGLSPYYFHRLFKKIVGVTPKQYTNQKRLERVRLQLQQDDTVTTAIYNAGYESSSRFYAQANATLGMKPSKFQRGGQGITIHFAIVPSYLGWVLVAATEQGICQIDFGDTPDALHTRLQTNFPQATLETGDADFEAIVAQVLAFLDAPDQNLTLPLDIQGTAFQQRVWAALQNIPVGTTASYAEVATHIGQPKAARAVAQACAANRLAVAIPCHRVVRSNGELGGYRWGIERKQTLLDREKEISS